MAKDKRLTGKQIERLLSNPEKIELDIVKPDSTNGLSRRCLTFRGNEKDFDTLNAEETLRTFCAFLRSVIARYEENKRKQEEAEAQEMDLSHCMELVDGLTEKEKLMIFRRLTDALQTRRTCKAENEILIPLYNYISDKELINQLINKLAQIQGATGTVKDTINNRSYGCRTSIRDDFRPEETTIMEEVK